MDDRCGVMDDAAARWAKAERDGRWAMGDGRAVTADGRAVTDDWRQTMA
ncbi:hypothetical protein [Humibacter sp.]|jgi:hypothetical protein|nr:hypothetical protein [Humibacter sp.]